MSQTRMEVRSVEHQALDAVLEVPFWESPEQAAVVREYVRNAYRNTLAILTDSLNTLHGIRWAEAQWALSLDALLYGMSAFCFDALREDDPGQPPYREGEDIEWRDLAFYSAIEMIEDLTWKAGTRAQAQRLARARGDEADRFLARIPELAIRRNDASPVPPGGRSMGWIRELVRGRHGARRALEAALQAAGPGYIAHAGVFRSRVTDLFILAATLGLARPFVVDDAYSTPGTVRFSGARRRSLFDLCKAHARFDAADELTGYLVPFVCQLLPTAFLEDFPDLLAVAQSKKPGRTKAIVTTLGFMTDPLLAIYAAEARESGASIIGVQHGGFYGEGFVSQFEEVERSHSDQFVTYGWQETERERPLPSPRLGYIQDIGKLRRRQRRPVPKGPLRVLWCTTSHDPAIQSIGHWVGARNDRAHAAQCKETIRTLLGSGLVRHVEFRHHPTLFDEDIVCSYADLADAGSFSISGATSKRLLDHALEYDIAILDNIGSSGFIECYTARIPAIVYTEPAFGTPRPSALPYYGGLEAVGLYCTTPEQLLQSLGGLAGHGQAWLSDPVRADALKRFGRRFARFSPVFWLHWSRFFWQLVRRQLRTSLTRAQPALHVTGAIPDPDAALNI
jgi:hypothetical protein